MVPLPSGQGTEGGPPGGGRRSTRARKCSGRIGCASKASVFGAGPGALPRCRGAFQLAGDVTSTLAPKRGESAPIHADPAISPRFQALVPETRARLGRHLKASARLPDRHGPLRPVAGKLKPMRVSLPLRARRDPPRPQTRGYSSVGRAPGSHPGGRGFESRPRYVEVFTFDLHSSSRFGRTSARRSLRSPITSRERLANGASVVLSDGSGPQRLRTGQGVSSPRGATARTALRGRAADVRAAPSWRRSDPLRSAGGACAAWAAAPRRPAARPRSCGRRRRRRRAGCGRRRRWRQTARSG